MTLFQEINESASVEKAAEDIVKEVSETTDLGRRMKIIREVTDPVLVQITSEGGDSVVSMMPGDAAKVRALLKEADEWPDEVNDILNRARPLNVVGTVNTMGDGWGWYENGEE